MRRGTTPTYTIVMNGVETDDLEDICLAFYQTKSDHELNLHFSEGRVTLTLDGAFATLTQEETNAFEKGTLKRQIKLKFHDGTVWSSDIEKETVYDVIHEEVL
jgi:hypothetical protein